MERTRVLKVEVGKWIEPLPMVMSVLCVGVERVFSVVKLGSLLGICENFLSSSNINKLGLSSLLFIPLKIVGVPGKSNSSS